MSSSATSKPDQRTAEAKVLLQTRAPLALRAYLKRYAKHHHLTLETLVVEVITHFVSLRPDLRGLHWRIPHSSRTDTCAAQGWAQLNVWMPNELGGKISGLALETQQSRAALIYTALYWFARYLRPPVAPETMPPLEDNESETDAVFDEVEQGERFDG